MSNSSSTLRPSADQPPDAAVVLVAHHDGRRRLGDVVGGIVERANLSVVAAGIVDAHQRAAVDEKLVELLLKLVVVQRLVVRAAARAASRAGGCAAGVAGGLLLGAGPPAGAAFSVFITSASSRRSAGLLKVTCTCCGTPTSTILPFTVALSGSRYAVKRRPRRPLGQRHLHGLPADDAVGPWRPAERLDDERVLHRRHEMRGQTFVAPSGAVEIPRLEASLLQPPGVHLFDRPLPCRFEVRRTGHPGTVDVREHVQRLQDLRVVGALPGGTSRTCPGRRAPPRRRRQTRPAPAATTKTAEAFRICPRLRECYRRLSIGTGAMRSAGVNPKTAP